jgi:uncharacterized protein
MSELILPARMDGALVNAATGANIAGRDKSLGWSAGTLTILDQHTVEVLHAESFECKNVIETLPEEMTREWIELTIDDGDSELIAQLTDYEHRIGLRDGFREAQTKANLYGGAILVLFADDGKAPDEPLDTKAIRSISGCESLDRWQVMPIGNAPHRPDFYQVVSYGQLLNQNGAALAQGKIHHSRVFRFDGDWAPLNTRLYNQGWGISKLQRFLKPFQDYFSSYQALGAMIQDASLFVYAIKDLMEIIKGGNAELLRDRLRENYRAMSVYGAYIRDADKEQIGFTERNFSGLDQLLARYEQRLVAGSDGLPHSYVLGRSGPNGGLDGNGDAEAKYMAQLVKRRQEKQFRGHLERCFELISAAKDSPLAGKKIKLGINFKPLYLPTPQEQAEFESVVIQKDSQAISAGIYTADEAAISHYSTPTFNPAITIDWKKRAQEKRKAEEEEAAAAEEEQLQSLMAELGIEEEEAPPSEENQDSAPRADAQCGKGWVGTKPPGCKRAAPKAKAAQEKQVISKVRATKPKAKKVQPQTLDDYLNLGQKEFARFQEKLDKAAIPTPAQQAALSKAEADFKRLANEIAALEKSGEPVPRKLKTAFSKAESRCEQLTMKQAKRTKSVWDSFSQSLLSMDRAAAEDLASTVTIDDSVKGYQHDIKTWIADFYQISNGRGTFEEVIHRDDRSWMDDATGQINFGAERMQQGTGKQVFFHEIGHFLEIENPALQKASTDWILRQATGAPQPLRHLLNDKEYKIDEVAYPDHFVHPYIGKIYDDNSTEVISMGMEYFSNPTGMSNLHRLDREHFHFMLGVLKSRA